MEIAILAAGCFWSPEIKFSKLNGVLKTEVGYCGGDNSKTSYKEVCTGKTNHAEVVKIEFDDKVITYEQILDFFFEIHDPTTLNQQGYDIGTQYRSEIFYTNDFIIWSFLRPDKIIYPQNINDIKLVTIKHKNLVLYDLINSAYINNNTKI